MGVSLAASRFSVSINSIVRICARFAVVRVLLVFPPGARGASAARAVVKFCVAFRC
jgi:hypothetical protein